MTQSYGSKVERPRLPDYRNSKTGKTRRRKAQNLKPGILVRIDRLSEKAKSGKPDDAKLWV